MNPRFRPLPFALLAALALLAAPAFAQDEDALRIGAEVLLRTAKRHLAS